MRVRLGTNDDLSSIEIVVKNVVPLMQAAGNVQWDQSYPLREHFSADVENSFLWVAEDDNNNIAGFAALTTSASLEYANAACDMSIPAVETHRMAVDPAYGGQGVGKLLLEKAEDVARDIGYTLVRVDTNCENVGMRKLIVKTGYTYKGDITLPGFDSTYFCCYEKAVSSPFLLS